MTTTLTTRSAVKAVGLRKAFGDKVVLDGIDLDITEGTVFALLGPNGAGKTTTVQILSTLLPADAGDLSVAGFDLGREADAARRVVGVTGQFAAVDGLLTGEENLILMADLRHLGRSEGRRLAAELLERHRLVTVTWPGGAGKTRLAAQVATSQANRYPEGVWWVDLAAVTGVQVVAGGRWQ